MLALLLLLLQAASSQPAAAGPSFWEMTMSHGAGEPWVQKVCQPPVTDEEYLTGIDAMVPSGGCSAPALTRTPQGWVRERTCRVEGRPAVIRSERKGDDADVTFVTSMAEPGKPPRHTYAMRMRRLGACPAE